MPEQNQALAPVEHQPHGAVAPATPAPLRPAPAGRWRAFLPALLPLLIAAVVWLVALTTQTALGAVVLEYFNVVPSSSAVLLEWSTLSEYNLRGFEVLCKEADEPAAAYHRIGFFNPKGNATQGAQYDMLVTDLAPGQVYCFRLVEITTDETPGEERERCGYGLGITPTPALAAAAPTTSTAGITPTVVLFPTPTLPFGITPTLNPFAPTPTATLFGQPASPLATPNPLGTPLGFAPTDPALAAAQAGTPDPFAQPTVDPFATPTPDPFAVATATLDPFATPTLDPFATPTTDPALLSPLPTPVFTPVITATATITSPVAPMGNADDGAVAAALQTPPADAAALPGAADQGPSPTPTSLYEIITATPVPAINGAGVAPAVTPWPTSTPPGSLLAGMLTPTAQNLTVMLLCFIFLSASVLGGLGLITSVLWMRSRSQRDADELRMRARLDRDRRRLL